MVMPAPCESCESHRMPVTKLMMLSLLSQEIVARHETRLLSPPKRRARSPSASASAILLPMMRSPLSLCVLARRATFSTAEGGDAQGSDWRQRCERRRCRWARSVQHQRLDAAAVESVFMTDRGLRMTGSCMSLVHVHGWCVWSILCEKKTMRHCSFLVALILGHRAAPRLSLP